MPKPAAPTSVEAVRHTGDSQVNIPTAELGPLAEAEATGSQPLRYPRDPSLDPQLVWKGKDEQDGEDLVVPAVPIHIQEQISPKAIIEDLRATTAAGRDTQLDLFHSDFNGMAFDERVDFYHHPMKWSNRMILGDSLMVMSSLAEKEGLKGQVQAIYLDPPYGIKFGSNWQVSTRKRDVKDGRAEDATRQPEQVRAFRDTWELGINSYLSYMRDRLVVARELLTESGSIFIQIGDENLHLVRSLLDEVFGSDNFCALIFFLKTSGKGGDFVDSVGDYLLWYARDKSAAKVRPVYTMRQARTVDEQYTMIELDDGTSRRLSQAEVSGLSPMPGGRRFMPSSLYSDSGGSTTRFDFELEGESYPPLPGYFWRTNREGLARLAAARRLLPVGRYLRYKMFSVDYPVVRVANVWDDVRAGGYGEAKIYVVQTNVDVVARALLLCTDPGDLGPVNERYRSDWSVRAIEPVVGVAQCPVCGRRYRADERRVGPGRGPFRPRGSPWRAVPLPTPTDGRGDAVLGPDGLPVALPA